MPVHRATRERRPDTRPQEIMEAALDLFSARGFRTTTLEQVAEAAGVTKGAIYHYFKGKEDLLLQAMGLWLESNELPAKYPKASDGEPVSPRLRHLIRQIWDMWMEPDNARFLHLLEGELVPHFPELVQRWMEESALPIFDAFSSLLEEGVRSGEFRKDMDVEVVVQFLILGTKAIAEVHLVKFQSDILPPLPADRVIDSVMDVFFRGIRTHSGD